MKIENTTKNNFLPGFQLRILKRTTSNQQKKKKGPDAIAQMFSVTVTPKKTCRLRT